MEASWAATEDEAVVWEETTLRFVSSLLESDYGRTRLLDHWISVCAQNSGGGKLPLSQILQTYSPRSRCSERTLFRAQDILIHSLTIFTTLLSNPITLSVIVEMHHLQDRDLRRRWRGLSASQEGDCQGPVAHNERLSLFDGISWAEIPNTLLTEEELALLQQLLHGRYKEMRLFHHIERPQPTCQALIYRNFVFNQLINQKVAVDRYELVAWMSYKILRDSVNYGQYFQLKRLLAAGLKSMSEDFPKLQPLINSLTVDSVHGYALRRETFTPPNSPPIHPSSTTRRKSKRPKLLDQGVEKRLWKLVSTEELPPTQLTQPNSLILSPTSRSRVSLTLFESLLQC